MKIFLLLVEMFLYGFSFYLIRRKGELGIIYIPVLFFAFTLIDPVLPLPVFYGTVGLVFFLVFRKNYTLLQQNVFSVLLFLYFVILLTRASDTIKYSLVYSVLIFFLALPMISLVYKKYSYEVIFKELTNSALIILVLFVLNVICASITRYVPEFVMYGISSGVLFGNIELAEFNVIGIALFVVLMRLLHKGDLYIAGIYIAALAFMMLTMRRSAMFVCVLGIPFAILSTLTQKAAKKVLLFVFLTAVIGSVIYFNSSFASIFEERYAMRNLDEKKLDEEQRFSEYSIVYDDMFVFKDYSPLFGYGLFNSIGNYGRGMYFGRSLHSDLASIAHSSGLIGVVLYIFMILTAFITAFRASTSRADKIIIGYCFIVFTIYNITGRFTQAETMLLLFLVCNLSLTKKEKENEQLAFEEKPVAESSLTQVADYQLTDPYP